jgi:Ca2+-binding EF-hand superfamily protein
MGQSVSAPRAHPDLADFLNFPKEALDSLWTSYNLLGEGWGLNVDEMIAIFKGAEFVASNYKFTDAQLRGLFKAFDTDNNGLVDALELFVTIALASGGWQCQ